MKKLLSILFVLFATLSYSQSNFYKHSSVVITDTEMKYPGGIVPFVLDTTGLQGYEDFTSLKNISDYGNRIKNFQETRNILISDYMGNWASLSLEDRKSLVRFNIYPDGTTTIELDSCYSILNRNKYKVKCMDGLKACSITIIQDVSGKDFQYKVDSVGTIYGKRVTPHEIITH